MGIKIDMSDLILGRAEINQMIGETVKEVTTKVALDVHAALVVWSPVDSGEFRGDWDVETPSKPFDGASVSNSKPYGPGLAHGASDQAADGSIDNAIDAATRL